MDRNLCVPLSMYREARTKDEIIIIVIVAEWARAKIDIYFIQ